MNREYPQFQPIQLINHNNNLTDRKDNTFPKLLGMLTFKNNNDNSNSTNETCDNTSTGSSDSSSKNTSPNLNSNEITKQEQHNEYQRLVLEFTLENEEHIDGDMDNAINSSNNSNKFRRLNRKPISNTAKVHSPSRIIEYMNGIIKTNNISTPNKPQHTTNTSIHIEQSFISSQYVLQPVLSKTIIELSYKENQNIIYNKAMEDKGNFTMYVNSNFNSHLISLFDGHGGSCVSSYLQTNIIKVFKSKLIKYNTTARALFNTFLSLDKQLKQLNIVNMGSTGTCVYITKENNVNIIYCANIGDTRCVLISPTNIERISSEHRASEKKEKQRIENSGGVVINGRVNGRLMLSRAFGDFELKTFGVKAEPHVSRKEINEAVEGKDLFMVLACDGVWDVLSEVDIQNIIKYELAKNDSNNNITERISNTVLNSALSNAAWDNLSVFIVKLT